MKDNEEIRHYTEIPTGTDIGYDDIEGIRDQEVRVDVVENIISEIKEFRKYVAVLEKKDKYESEIHQDVINSVADIGEILSDFTSKNNLEREYLEGDNEKFNKFNLLGFIHDFVKGKTAESVFGSTDEGICLKLANIANLVAHSAKSLAVGHGKKAGISVVALNDRREKNNIGGILDKMDKARTEEYDIDIEQLNNAIKAKYNPEDETIKKIHELMDRAWIKKDNINEQTTKEFATALKANNLKSMLYDVKGDALDAAVFSIVSKKRKIEELKAQGMSEEEIKEEYGLQVYLQACEEKKSSNDSTYTINGEKTIRIIAHFGSALPVNFHISEKEFIEIQEKYDYKIERNDRLPESFPVSMAIPYGTLEENEAKYKKGEEFLTREEKSIREDSGSKRSRDIFKKERDYYYTCSLEEFEARHHYDREAEKRADELPALLEKPSLGSTIKKGAAILKNMGNRDMGDEQHEYR